MLRQQFDRAMATAVGEMQTMAQAWEKCGLTTALPLPKWLAAAVEDLNEVDPSLRTPASDP